MHFAKLLKFIIKPFMDWQGHQEALGDLGQIKNMHEAHV